MPSSNKNPGSAANAAFLGIWPWVNPNNIKTRNSVYSTASFTGLGNVAIRDYTLQLIDASHSYAGTDHADLGTDWPAVTTVASYGNSSDLWGIALTPSIVNDPDFGCVLQASVQMLLDTQSDFLEAYNFGFTVPATASIVGVSIDINRNTLFDSRTSTTSARVDDVSMTVYYTLPADSLIPLRLIRQGRMGVWH